jgi:xanthine dehydrogenase YagR molybdenum-binding subunit
MMQEDVQTHPQKQMTHRYDGVSKVTGTAKYAAEFTEPFAKKDLLYGYVVQATIPSGTVASIDRAAAERSSGVIAVMTPFNAPKLPAAAGPAAPPARRSVTVLQNADVYYNGQPIAVVVARSLAEAQHAASLLRIRYAEQPAQLEFRKHLGEARMPKSAGKEPPTNHRGDVVAGMAKAAVVVDETYITPIQNHNPMEPHATIAWWDGDKLNVYDATQYISGGKQTLARQFQIPMDNVRVQCPNTGGGFGSKGSLWSHATLAAMAAKVVGKPVKIVLGREQMFGPVGARPSTVNHIKLGATADGKLVGIEQDVVISSSVMEDFVEHSAGVARMLYDSPTLRISEKMVDQNIGVGTFQRAPGEAPGTAVLEIAMDELAEKLKMDPLQLRLVNYAEKDPSHDRPWTSKHLREAYTQAAERFGWSKRNPQPGMTREGNKLIGYGMGTATYPANRSAAQAVVRILPGGRAFVGCGTQDLGTGMYTMMAQTCADGLGLDPSMVEVKLGDSMLPKAPVSGGSQSTASVTPAIKDAAMQAKLKLGELAIAQTASPLYGLKSGELEAKGGSLVHKSGKSDTFAAILERAGNQPVEAMGSAEPGQDRDAYTSQSFGAVFAEVAVDVDTHMVQVRRVVATYDIGTLLNDKTGINQLQGGIVWGVGFALHEETVIDPVYGRTVNENLAEYHVPVNADIGTLDVTVLNIADTKFNPLGARGIGEIGITGAAAAIANAIYNATGKRVREYPITPDKIMRA